MKIEKLKYAYQRIEVKKKNYAYEANALPGSHGCYYW